MIFWTNSTPATTRRALKKRLNPSIGATRVLMRRWSCSTTLFQFEEVAVAELETQIPAHASDDDVGGEPALTKERVTGGAMGNHAPSLGTTKHERQNGEFISISHIQLRYSEKLEAVDSFARRIPVSELTTARKRVENYLLAVKKRRRHAPTHRYISVETLRPTKKQVDDYTKKREKAGLEASELSVHRVEPSQLHCLMVFDTQTRQFAGSVSYLVSSEAPIWQITTFQTVSAEFVGPGTL
jgi:hypothetical protein